MTPAARGAAGALLLLSLSLPAPARARDRDAPAVVLARLYDDLDGPNWDDPWDVDLTDVRSNPAPCDGGRTDPAYRGVVCAGGEVVEVNLPDSGLAGTVPGTLWTDLPGLRRVDFSRNRIADPGWDAAAEGDVAAVEEVDLTNNLVRTVDGVEKLRDTLAGLHLTYNHLRGTLPDALFRLTQLEVLALSENSLTGTVDPRLGRLTRLQELYCYGNQLTGTLPPELGRLTRLQILTFAENRLEGPLPAALRDLGNLRTFSVHNNDPGTGAHSGPLPAFDRHPFLNELYLDGNDFTGSIPRNLLHAFNGTSGETVTLGLSNNQLTGTIPVTLLKFDSLVLNVVGNQITGFDDRVCVDPLTDAWMNGLVERFGCDAVLCPVGTWTDTGRQEDPSSPCEDCAGADQDGFPGATACDSAGSAADDTVRLEILAEFYLALGGADKWEETAGWDAFASMESREDVTLPSYQERNIDACAFHGVECNDVGRLRAVKLPNNGLEGLVPASFWDLAGLEEVDLAGNELRLGRDFGFGDMGNAKDLQVVDLSSNDIQSFAGLGRCAALRELRGDDLYFYAPLDPVVYDLSNLELLHLQYSGLKGALPPGLKRLENLRALNFYGNELTGTIPEEIGELPQLWHVDLSENDLSGTIPADALAKLPKLEKFHVHHCGTKGAGVSGPLPSFKEQAKLHLLDVKCNNLNGPIPDDFLAGITGDRVDSLMDIDIGFNQLTGTIPALLQRFTNMHFSAVKNRFTGVDSQLCNQRGWWSGDVGNVIDRGDDGCDAILCPKGTFNEYGRARSGSGGRCSACAGSGYAGAVACDNIASGGGGGSDAGGDAFDLSGLDGLVPEASIDPEKQILDKLYYATGGPDWVKGGDGWTDGPVCEYYGVTCTADGQHVAELNFVGFGLIASITSGIYQLPELRKLDFSQNEVDLSFDGIAAATKLEEIVMKDADLTSVDGIDKAPNLKRLHISRNSFPDGSIPAELYRLTDLTSLAISYNGFDGTIRPGISQLSSLQEFWSSSNDLTGSIPTEMGDLSELNSLVLNGNRMSGEIPSELNNLPKLTQLHLQRQRDFGGFSGPLPSFKTMPHLHDLDISGNSLTGSIPDDFMETVRLSDQRDDYAYPKINLASNRITGTIPGNFDAFIGLFINAAGNRISGVPGVLCDDDDEYMGGLVGELTENKCDAILCPPGTSSPVGRQEEANSPCTPCPGGTDEERKERAPYFGMLKCGPISAERHALEQLHGLIFTDASDDINWMSDEPICSWYGITCDDVNADSGVTDIKLESNSLATDKSAEVTQLFFQLRNLESLNIRGNEGLQLTFANAAFPPNLELLQVSATGLTRDHLKGISGATKLKELHITENDIDGPFPDEIFELMFMERLFVSFNEISGPLPTRIGTLSDLTEFYAYTNKMTGTIPTELGNLADIETLVLGKNNFEGTLPTELNNLSKLKEFSVYFNKAMTGPVLSFSNVERIEKLDIEGNQFTGTIPSDFLSGLDPDYVAGSDNEIILHLASNALSGPLPDGLSSIKNLYLDIVGNRFTKVPDSFCQDFQKLWMNGKVEKLGCKAIACPQNTFSDTGRLHEDGDTCNSCEAMYAAPFIGSFECAHVDKEVAALKALYRGTKGSAWEKNDHWMDDSKPICSWYGVECSGNKMDNNTITEINLPDNSLEGTLPPAIFELPALKTLNVKNNKVFIKFDNIGKAKKLEVLYISNIDIGSIDGIGKAPSLRELHVTENKITGELPDDLFELADTMESLYIAYNSFSGTLSEEFGKMKQLKDFYAYDNEFTGEIPEEFASLPNLQHLVLAENKLSGTISEDFSYMPQLSLFSAYRRLKTGPKLFGPLPSFSNVPKLEALYLDYNHFSGTIPSDFVTSSLSDKLRVTISNNLMSGKVPTTLLAHDALNIEMEGNKFTQMDDRFCDKTSWMGGLVEQYQCDALMCKPGFYSIYGRQNSTDSACQRCESNADFTPFWGSTSCDRVVDERDILELLYNELGGDDWHNNDNWLLSDDICSWYGVECRDGSTVQAIRLGANNLVGTPPPELFLLQQIHTLWLHSNPINFKFKGIEEAKNLVELRVDATGLSDVFGVGEATSLIKLDLKYNQISGQFPIELLKLEKLESLFLTDNRLSGPLPNFERLKNLVSLRLGSNMFSGEPHGFSALEYLLHLDLSDNDLVGTIPHNFLNNISRRKPIEVDLSSNNLSGGLPLELDSLDQLVIYLRDNKFTELDPSLCDNDNQGWNLRGIEMFGCDAIMCPPGTANYHGRQSGENNPCMKCASNKDLYGQITCDGTILQASSSSTRLLQGVVWTSILCSLAFGVLLL